MVSRLLAYGAALARAVNLDQAAILRFKLFERVTIVEKAHFVFLPF